MPPRISSLITVLIASTVLGEVPSLELVKKRRYVIRQAVGQVEAIWRQEGSAGLWAWDIESGGWARLHPLIYGKAWNGDGAGLASREDLIIVQGTTFFEFDAATHRLLRRYSALGPGFRDWGFRGPLVTERMAVEWGVPPGYYGMPYCPPSPGPAGAFCPKVSFPGYPGPTNSETQWNLLYRRDDDGTLSLVKTFPSNPSDRPYDRFLALDPDRSRLWSLQRVTTGPTSSDSRLGYIPLSHAGLGDENIVEIQTNTPDMELTRRRLPLGLAYDAVTDSLIGRWAPVSGPWHVTRRPADLSGPEEIIDTNRHHAVALTTLAPGMPDNYEQVLPAIGRGPGLQGTFWRSDLWIFNPSDQPITFSLRRVTKPDIHLQLHLPARGSLEWRDVLGMLGGGPTEHGGDGVITDALVIESPYRWGNQLTVYSRTYTTAPDGEGTYGQSVPAVPSREGYSTHVHDFANTPDVWAFPSEFYVDLRYPGRFRHNLGAVNDSPESLHIDLYYGGTGKPVGTEPTRRVIVPPHSVLNVNLERLLADVMLPTRPSLVLIAGSRPAPVWMSMVDNQSGDATFLPFTTFGLRGALDAVLAIPQVANIPGAHGTYWRSDLYGMFLEPAEFEPGRPTAFFRPAEPSKCGGSQRVETTLSGPSGQPGRPEDYPYASIHRRVYPDVVKQFPVCNSKELTGALEMNIGSWMSGFARIYSTREDGGTYGDILPFYPPGGWPVQHFSGIKISDSFRINLGFYNGLDYPVVHRLVVYDKGGAEVSRHDFAIEPGRSKQANIATFTGDLPPGLYGLSVIPLDSEHGPGRSWAYVSIVDNVTGDPINLW